MTTRFPPRLSHLATKSVLVAKLHPTYAEAHEIDEEEAADRLAKALTPQLVEDLLQHTWEALNDKGRKIDEAALLEKIARTLKDRPQRPGKKAQLNPSWSA